MCAKSFGFTSAVDSWDVGQINRASNGKAVKAIIIEWKHLSFNTRAWDMEFTTGRNFYVIIEYKRLSYITLL